MKTAFCFLPSAFSRLPARELSLLLCLAALLAYLGVRAPRFFTPQNLVNVLSDNAYVAIAAFGMTMVIVSGGIDISVGSMLAVCSIVAGLTARANAPLPLILFLTGAVGALMGTLNGALVAKANVPAIIVTLGMMGVLRGLIIWQTRGEWIQDLPSYFSDFGNAQPLGVPLPLWTMTLTLIFTFYLMSRTRFGKRIYALGSNPEAVRLAGVSVPKATFSVFALNGLFIGIAALADPTNFSSIQSNKGEGFEFQVIIAVVLGGTNIFGGSGNVGGTLMGVLLLGTMSSAMTFLPELSQRVEWERTMQATLVLAAVVIDQMRQRRQSIRE
jgi:ribose/xylose/arabinose/galactoside ABC-type transport system permease subunit